MELLKNRPLIGMTYSDMSVRDEQMRVRTYCTRKYFGALQKVGARVILLPPVEEKEAIEDYLNLIEGLLLPGGEDVDPRYQNEDPVSKLGIVNPFRDYFELEMARSAYNRKLPTLGICRGLQVMAIALGGSVHQDISAMNVIQHSQSAPRWATSHRIDVIAGSRLSAWTNRGEFYTNSFHHQSVNRVPNCLRISAKTGDGLIEALESADDRIFLGVQWHPEETWHCDDASKRIFTCFVENIHRKHQ